MNIIAALLLSILVIGGVSCGPTTESIQAPFKLTSDFTSSTSGSTTLLDLSAKARQKLEQFVVHSYDAVSCDIAQGHGEYLTSLAILAGIPTNAQAAFQTEMQSRYAVLSDRRLSHKEAWTLVVNYAWSAGYGQTGTKYHPTAASGL